MTDTNLSDTLAALSEAATQGEWKATPYYYEGGDGSTKRLIDTGFMDTIAEVRMGHEDIEGSIDANAAFIVALANAYRTGQLVPVPSVEVLARAMAEQANDYDGDVLQWQCWADSATAVIAAMQEGRE